MHPVAEACFFPSNTSKKRKTLLRVHAAVSKSGSSFFIGLKRTILFFNFFFIYSSAYCVSLRASALAAFLACTIKPIVWMNKPKLSTTILNGNRSEQVWEMKLEADDVLLTVYSWKWLRHKKGSSLLKGQSTAEFTQLFVLSLYSFHLDFALKIKIKKYLKIIFWYYMTDNYHISNSVPTRLGSWTHCNVLFLNN